MLKYCRTLTLRATKFCDLKLLPFLQISYFILHIYGTFTVTVNVKFKLSQNFITSQISKIPSKINFFTVKKIALVVTGNLNVKRVSDPRLGSRPYINVKRVFFTIEHCLYIMQIHVKLV